ncbi:MAG: CHAD domain-containing protein [Gammaproteobacteria bacterium]|nr:CHAD domain-containing protein [Gammaproteobacteria bacterium]
MSYRLRTGESVQDGIRRVISEQIEKSLGEVADTNLDRADTIHQVRKRCKKIRAALRLIRGALGEAYSKENAWYRDVARRISDVRDTEAMIETCGALAEHFDAQVDREIIRPIRLRLETRKNTLMEDTGRIDKLLQDFESAMVVGHKRVATLSIESDGYGAALEGMRRTYSRACAAMDAACDNPTPDTFHEWRKRVKYHWYHMRLLRDTWPTVVRARRDEAEKLGELLGNHHDLCVLRAWVLNDPASSAKEEVLTSFIKLVEERTAQIERESKPLGRRLFAEKPKHLARRFAIYFSVWSEED